MRGGNCVRFFVPLVIAAGFALAGAAGAATLELVETAPDEPWGSWSRVGDTDLKLIDPNGGFTVEASWTPPPAIIGPEGFSLTLNARAAGLTTYVYAGIGANSDGLAFEPSPHVEFMAAAGQSISQSLTVMVAPRDDLELGQRVRLSIGANNGIGVSYYYQVTSTAGGRLEVSHDCPPKIVISALPSVNCHLIISGWRRNTADPVRVTLPEAFGTYGNHPNGIQVLGQGEEDIFEWVEPRLWGLFIFGCPSQKGTGANCYNSVTTPGPVSVPILVQQGNSPPVQIDLDFLALRRP